MAKNENRWQVVIEQAYPPPISFNEVKDFFCQHVGISMKSTAAVTTYFVEFPTKAEADDCFWLFGEIYPGVACRSEQIPCEFCLSSLDINPLCHIVPNFMIQYQMDNTIGKKIMYDQDNKNFAHTMIAPPYFCKACENGVFNKKWETPFVNSIFGDPLNAGNAWGQDAGVGFSLLMCFRYAVHCLVADGDPNHQPIGFKFRDLARAALDNFNEVGKSIFIYPWIYRPIVKDTKLKPHINTFLSLGFDDKYLLADGMLPDMYLIKLPKMFLLFSVVDLTAIGQPGFGELVQLKWNQPFDAKTANMQLPELLSGVLNQGLLKTQNDQTGKNEWFKYDKPDHRATNPDLAMYAAHDFDKELLKWHEEQKAKK